MTSETVGYKGVIWLQGGGILDESRWFGSDAAARKWVKSRWSPGYGTYEIRKGTREEVERDSSTKH